MRHGYMDYGPGWGMSPGAWILMVLFWIALATVIVVGVVMLVRALGRPAHAHGPLAPTSPKPPPPPLASGAQQILDERFARGEIDIDEYRQRGDELRGARPPADPPPPPAPPPGPPPA